MISFCVITDMKREFKLKALIHSIHNMTFGEDYEIIIAVDNGEHKLGKLRNQACRGALGDILVVCDDDLVFDTEFYKELAEYPYAWNVLCPRLLNVDGSRYWDWRWRNGDSQKMVSYDQPDDGSICPPGAITVLRRAVLEKASWRNDLKYYEPPYEDVEFARRLHEAGFMCTMNPRMVVYHNDSRYTQEGNIVVKREKVTA